MNDREVASVLATIALVATLALAISARTLALFADFAPVSESLVLWKLVSGGIAALAGVWGAWRSKGRRRARFATMALAALVLAFL